MATRDWDALKFAFISDPKKPELGTFAGTQKIPYDTMRKRAGKEKWVTLRDEHWHTVGTKSSHVLIDLQAHTLAADTASRLTEIRAMADHAYRAIVPANGEALQYEKPSDAVQSYERLIKLERLLTDQSTEIISVRDARQMVDDILTTAEEVFGNDARLSTFAQRLAGLRPPEAASQAPLGASLN